jgi:hypothetical protein
MSCAMVLCAYEWCDGVHGCVCIGSAAVHSLLLTWSCVIAFLKASLSYHYTMQFHHTEAVAREFTVLQWQIEDNGIPFVSICRMPFFSVRGGK